MQEQIQARRKKVLRDGTIIAISILIAVLVHQSDFLGRLLTHLFGIYFVLGAFLTGIFFASTFTVAIATSVFLFFTQAHNPLTIAIFGGLGAFVGDSLIFKFLKDDLIRDFEYLEKLFPQRLARRIIHSKLIFWFAPIMAAVMIASPLPDEIGLLVLASIKLKYQHFFLLSFLLNTLGILIIALFGRII